MSLASRKNIGAFLTAAFANAPVSLTAAGAGDNTLVNGAVVDRFAFGEPLSASVIYSITATVANTKTLSLAYKVQHGSAADGSDMADYAPAVVASAVVLNGNAGGTAQTLIVKQDVDLNGAKEYVRVVFTPDLSATSVDVATVTPVWVFGGMAELPQPAPAGLQ